MGFLPLVTVVVCHQWLNLASALQELVNFIGQSGEGLFGFLAQVPQYYNFIGEREAFKILLISQNKNFCLTKSFGQCIKYPIYL